MTQHECTVYKCGYCRKKYFVKHACERHEKFCAGNPNNWHACFTCLHLEKGEISDGNFKSKTFTCTKNGKELHSYVAERIGHSCVGITERMPILCGDYLDEIEATLTAHEVANRMLGVNN